MADVRLPDIVGRVRVDSRDATKGLNEVQGSVNKTSSAFTSMGSTLTKVVGGAALLKFAQNATTLASDTAEAASKVGVVFGEARRDVDAFAETSARALGVSKREALSAAGTFGNLFTATGLAKDAAADMSVDVVKLAADLGSFNNLGTEEVLEKLRSGLVGEIEPLRALGINFNAATVEAKAMELGLAGVGDELTEGEKVQARYALIVEQSSSAHGDFARTADGMANSAKTAAASAEDAQATLGEALAPTMARINGLLTTTVDGFNSLPAPIQQVTLGVGLLSGAVILLAGRTAAWTLATKAAALAQKNLSLSMLGPAGIAAGTVLVNRELNENVGWYRKLTENAIEAARTIPLVGDAYGDLLDKINGVTTGQGKFSEAFRGSAGATTAQKLAAQGATGATDALGQAQARAKPLTEAETQALKDQQAALEKLSGAMISAVSTQLGYEASVNTLKDNINDLDDRTREYTQAVEENGPASKEAEAANRALRDIQLAIRQSALDAAGAAVTLAESNAEAAGFALTAEEKHNIFRQALMDLAAQAEGPSKQAIEELAGSIDALPNSKTVTVNANTSAAIAAISSLERRLASISAGAASTAGPQQFAMGMEMGPVRGRPGQAVPIVAHAGEWVLTPEQLADLQRPAARPVYMPSPAAGTSQSAAPPVVHTTLVVDGKALAEATSRGSYELRRARR